MTPHQKHLQKPLRQFVGSAVVFFVTVSLGVLAVQRLRPPDGSLDAYLSLLPGVALAVWFYLLFRYMRHYDEMLRHLLMQALAVAGLTGLVFLFTAMIQRDLGLVPLGHAFIISAMAIAFIVCALYLKWRYR